MSEITKSKKAEGYIRKEMDERSQWFLKLTVLLLIAIFATLLVINSIFDLAQIKTSVYIYSSLVGINIFIYYLIIRNYSKEASYILVFTTWAALAVLSWLGNGIYSPANIGMLVVILFTILLINRFISSIIAVLSLLNFYVLTLYALQGYLFFTYSPVINQARDYTLILLATLLLVVFYEGSMHKSVERITELLLQKEIDQKQITDYKVNYQEIFESISDAIFIHHAETWKIEDVNQSACIMFGFEKNELLTKSIDDISATHEHYNLLLAENYFKQLNQNGFTFFEWRSKRANGTTFWSNIQLKASIINGEKKIMAVVRDNDKFKLDQLALRSSEERLKATLENTPNISIQWYTIDGDVIFWNKASEKIFGYTSTEAIGKSLDKLILTEQENENFKKLLIRINKDKQAVEPYEIIVNDKYGNSKILLSTTFAIPGNYNQNIFVCMDSDITQLKQAEAKIYQLNEVLEQKVIERTEQLKLANMELEEFSTGISHDLRAPLRHIDGFIQLLYAQIQDPNEKINDYYNKITYSTHRTLEMLDDLLSFARLGRKELVFSQVKLSEIVAEIIETLKPDWEKRNLKWIISDLPMVSADKNLIKLVFENLLSNALKYTSKTENAIIEIGEIYGNKNFYDIYIKDNGIGFDMEYAGKLFGVFQRLHTSEEFEGTGIGLANVKHIIAKHKGNVSAQAKLNGGATFNIQLPKQTL